MYNRVEAIPTAEDSSCYVMVYKSQDKDKEVLFETNLYSEIKTEGTYN